MTVYIIVESVRITNAWARWFDAWPVSVPCDGRREERTGLHENEFIETRRHWLSVPVRHNTGGGVNVLNLVEGDEAVVESPTGEFEPFVVHYAETFIIPACVGDYTIRPFGRAEGKIGGTIKAYVRFRQ